MAAAMPSRSFSAALVSEVVEQLFEIRTTLAVTLV